MYSCWQFIVTTDICLTNLMMADHSDSDEDVFIHPRHYDDNGKDLAPRDEGQEDFRTAHMSLSRVMKMTRWQRSGLLGRTIKVLLGDLKYKEGYTELHHKDC